MITTDNRPVPQSGFTLVELMIVIAIVAVLAAIAVPQYQDYIARSQISGALAEVAALRSAAEEKLMRGLDPSVANGGGTAAADLGFTSSNLIGTTPADDAPVVTLTQNGAGNIEADLQGRVSAGIKGTLVGLDRAADGTWTCYVDGAAATSFKPSFIPPGCAAADPN